MSTSTPDPTGSGEQSPAPDTEALRQQQAVDAIERELELARSGEGYEADAVAEEIVRRYWPDVAGLRSDLDRARADLAEVRVERDILDKGVQDASKIAATFRHLLETHPASGVRTIPDDAAERVAEALREVRLNLGPNTLEAIYGGANHLVLSGAERHAIALTAIKALGLSTLTTDPDDEWEHRHDPADDIGCTNPPAVSCSDAGCPLHGHDTEEGDTDE